MNAIIFTSPRSASWANRAVAANLPYINVLLINVVQAIITIFLASDFIRRDKKLDTTETIYSRPITNGEYVIGKTLGIFSIFLGMVILVLLITLVFNFIKEDTPVIWQAYLLYPVLITIPTIIFILGLSFLAMILIKNQPVTFILLLGYIGLTLFLLKDKFYGLWDYMAFNLPMVYSDFIGFADPEKIILHRLTYLFLGFGFIFATIRWLNRLAQTGRWNNLNLFLFLFFLCMGIFSGYSYFQLNNKIFQHREYYKALNESHALENTPDIVSNNLDLRHKGNKLELNSELVLTNNSEQAIDTINLSLNPGFNNLQISFDGHPVNFYREGQIIRISPLQPLLKGDSLAFHLSYSGTPSEDICYLDIPDQNILQRRMILFANIGKHYGITSSDFVLLTPEILWYPIAGITYNLKTLMSRTHDFTTFKLNVVTKKGLVVFSQGEKTISGEGIFRFRPDTDLDGLSLIIGHYEQKSIKTDSLDITLAILPGHDFFTTYFTHIRDTIPDLIQEYKHQYEVETIKLSYPFKRVELIEVPVQFHAYQRSMTQTVENVQPEMFLMPEKGSGLSTTDFARFRFSDNRRNQREEQVRTPIEIETEIFRRFINQTFFIENSRSFTGVPGIPNVGVVTMRGVSFTRNPYSAFPQYYSFKTGFVSTEIPIFNTMVEAYLNGDFGTPPMMSAIDGMTDIERANLTLRDYSLQEVINSWRNSLIPAIISQKGYFLMTSLKNKVGINEFDDFMHDYIERHKFTIIKLENFRQDFIQKFNVDINLYLSSINTHGKIPIFLFGEIGYFQARDAYGPVYIVRFPVSNIGNVKGLIDLRFEAGGRRGFGGGGFSSSGGSEERIFEIDSSQTKEIQVRLYDQPRIMTINTIISENIPSTIRQFLRQPKVSNDEPREYEKILDHPVTMNYENEIIVDNEDPGFSYNSKYTETKLKKYIQSKKNTDEKISYSGTNFIRTPKKWTPVTNSGLYGRVRLSAMITSGSKTGDQTATWKAKLPISTLYNIYVYLPLTLMSDRSSMFGQRNMRGGDSRGGGRQGGGGAGGGQRGTGGTGGSIPGGGGTTGRSQGMQRIAGDGTEYNYSVISRNGQEHVEFMLSNIVDGWNKIGSFDLPADTVTIELSNKTTGKRVIADAVKFVRANDNL